MRLIYEEPQSMGGVLKIYEDKIVYKSAYLNPEQTILTKQIVSVNLSALLPQVILEMTGNQKVSITTSDKEKIRETILDVISGTAKPHHAEEVSPVSEPEQQEEKPEHDATKKKWAIFGFVIILICVVGIFTSGSNSSLVSSLQGNRFMAAAEAEGYAKDLLRKEGYLNIKLGSFPTINENPEKTTFYIENTFSAEIYARGIQGTYVAIVSFAHGSYEVTDIAFERD